MYVGQVNNKDELSTGFRRNRRRDRIWNLTPAGAGRSLPIAWQILDICDGRALLLSKYVLDMKPYVCSDTQFEEGAVAQVPIKRQDIQL